MPATEDHTYPAEIAGSSNAMRPFRTVMRKGRDYVDETVGCRQGPDCPSALVTFLARSAGSVNVTAP